MDSAYDFLKVQSITLSLVLGHFVFNDHKLSSAKDASFKISKLLNFTVHLVLVCTYNKDFFFLTFTLAKKNARMGRGGSYFYCLEKVYMEMCQLL